MDLRRTALVTIAATFLLTGCTTLSPPVESPPEETAPEPAASGAEVEPPVAQPAVRFHIDGPGTSPGSCAIRVYALHSDSLAPHLLHRTIELYRRSDDVFLVSLQGTSELPYEEATETVDGMQSPITGDNLDLDCDEIRAEILIEGCEPSPCPTYGVQDGYNLMPIEIKQPAAE